MLIPWPIGIDRDYPIREPGGKRLKAGFAFAECRSDLETLKL
jgi:hypothetical protein